MVIGKAILATGKWINGKWVKEAVEKSALKSKALVNFTTKPITTPLERGGVKINFVDNETFNSTYRRGLYVSLEPEMASEFHTEGIRTCTGVGMISHSDLEAGGLHYLDSSTTNFFLGRVLNNLFKQIKNPDSAIIIGGKNVEGRPFAVPNFRAICEEIQKRVPKVSIFGEHNFRESESHFHYSLKDNTFTINTVYKKDNIEHEVLSVDALHEAFKTVELAKGDALYINGERVFL